MECEVPFAGDSEAGDMMEDHGNSRLNHMHTSEWSYAMRREMQEIIPGLYLGPFGAALKSKLIQLKQMDITHVVCIRHVIESHFIRPNFPTHFQYLVIDIADSVTENIIQHIPKVNDFIDKCLKQGGKCLVHANAGISRSAAVVIAYLMQRYRQPFNETFRFVQQKRFCINPNEGFARQLREYEAIYKAEQDTLYRRTSPDIVSSIAILCGNNRQNSMQQRSHEGRKCSMDKIPFHEKSSRNCCLFVCLHCTAAVFAGWITKEKIP